MRMLSLAATLLAAAAAPAQTTVWTSADSCLIVPQARHTVIHPHDPRPEPMPVVKLEAVAVVLTIHDQVATTSLSMRLRNHSGAAQEAQVLLPVPDGAAVRSFHVEGLGTEPAATLLARDEARRIYSRIVASMRDPGLLEFAGYSHIRSSVFPVPSNGTQTVSLAYEQLLPIDGARVDYVLPRTESLDDTGVAWSFSADIESAKAISTVYSPSHDLIAERIAPGHVRVRAPGAGKPGAIRLSVLGEADGGVSASFLAYPDPAIGAGRSGYFMLLVGLPAAPPEEQRVKREVTLVIDRSGSMRGEKIQQAREAALQILEGLGAGDAFNVIDYSDSIESFSDKPAVIDAQTKEAARKYIEALSANGGTNIHDALIEALRQPPTEGALPMVLFLTDGLPTVGQTSEVAIREAAARANAHQRRIFTFGVGVDVNAPLLSNLARTSRATSTFVLPNEDVEVKVGQVFRRLSGPILAAPTLNAAVPGSMLTVMPVRELLPATMPDLFEGDQLVVLGQYNEEGKLRFTLRGEYLGREKEFTFDFDSSGATTRNAYVPRLWATRKIATLVDAIRQAAADSNIPGRPAPSPTEDPRMRELIDEIVRLSIKFGILTEYTAFLATGESARVALGLDESVWRAVAPADRGRAAGYAREELGRKVRLRDKGAGVSQEMNIADQAGAESTNPTNELWTGDLKKVQVRSVCQVADQTLYNRSGKWVDARILDKEAEAPDRVVKFGTKEFDEILDRLIEENRQGLLALGGDVLLSLGSERVLITWPEVEVK